MASPHGSLEWQSHFRGCPRFNPRIGFQASLVRAHLAKVGWLLDGGISSFAYQLSRADCGFLLCLLLRQTKIPLLHPLEDGQDIGVQVHQSPGWGPSQRLSDLTKEIYQFCFNLNIYITAEYFPGYLNFTAVWFSRFWRDSSDWQLNPSFFSLMYRPSVDLSP